MEITEPRALSAALAAPAFVTKTSGLAQHVADRHVERWAPEAGANRVRPLKNLGFVDRLVAPWIEAAQRSASMRMFSQYVSTGAPERATNHVSWVFPRPWYQDELDWMAASRQMGTQQAMMQAELPAMLTTRGTYVAPGREAVLPAALYEFVAPSLSIARPDQAMTRGEAYSPLVSHAATQAATMMARVMAPLAPTRALSPGLRAVLTTMLERSTRGAAASEVVPTRLSLSAPELVTPPAPRLDTPAVGDESAIAVADSYAEQHARIAELQRAARIASERELVARTVAAPAAAVAEPPSAAAITTRSEAAAASDAAVAAERARLEERIAQRVAERTGQTAAQNERAEAQRAELQRTQEARRGELLQRQSDTQRLHESARDAAARDARSAQVTPDAPRGVAPAARAIPAEVAAALAALPPELASLVAGGIAARPERAAQAIGELGDALRTIELMARTTASGGSFESARGPRLMMPAGLGGLVSTIERTTAEPGIARGLSPAAARAALAAQSLTGVDPSAGIAPDRSRSLARVPALPFLAPRAAGAPMSAQGALGAAASADPAALHHVAWADRWLARFAGAKSRSLDVLSASSGGSVETRYAALASAAPGAVFVAPQLDDRTVSRADDVTPATFSPGAAAQGALAARTLAPMAGGTSESPAVRIADDAETSDDMFAMISQAATRSRMPASTPAQVQASAAAAAAAADAARVFERETLADLVAHAVPAAPGAGLSAQLASSPFAAALRHVMPLASAPAFDIRALFGGGLSATYLAGLLAPATREIELASAWEPAGLAGAPGALAREVPEFSPTYVAPDEPRAQAESDGEGAASESQLSAPLTTLRSALLSWTVDAIDAGGGAVDTRVGAPTVRTETSRPSAYGLLDAMSLPTLGESAALRELGAIDLAGTTAHASSYAAPGAIADRAHAWSVAQERSSADLAFDFVPPELVLAARVYGLGPAEAAQAARLAIAGAGQLSAMAGAVDRTFVQALAIEHERRSGRPVTAYPTSADAAEAAALAARGSRAAAAGYEYAAPHAPATTAFGVDRRTPRGSFLWPAASVAALGLTASAPDGEQSGSVAALELLAAQAVAELGTYAALSPERARPTEGAAETGARGTTARGESAREAGISGEIDEQTVVATATAVVGSARRAKFEAMYVALGQSSTTRSWSPAARAARALALAGRGEETISARERAEIAWDVLPVVAVGALGADGEEAGGVLSTGQAAQRSVQQRAMAAELSQFVEQRPGLATLSSRAGEALGSYVTPQAAPPAAASTSSSTSSSSSSSRGEQGAIMRAPTAAPELVRTGPRYGGGEVELPAWFEKAAKKMFEMPTQLSDNISISELTLVQSAPSTHIAASSRSAPSAMPTPSPAQHAQPSAQLDIEKIANDVYRQILGIMDATRARNGEPYL